MKTKRFLAWCLVLAVFMTFMPSFTLGVSAAPTVIETSTKENTNQAGGIIYTKTSTAKSDGTIDIALTAHTTGEVKQLSAVTPTDIVLVLDTSGSMGDSYTTTTITGYNQVVGGQYTYTEWIIILPIDRTGYGLENTNSEYYINTGTAEEPVYTKVTYTGRDGNRFEMYEYSVGENEVVVYPKLSDGITAEREHSYDVVQFYEAVTESNTVNKMTELKSAVKSFIDTTVTMNTGLDTKDMHSISIVQFASNASVVAELTAVDATGASDLKDAVDGLSANGATAVDYGLEAAEEILMNRSQVQSESAVDRNEVIIVFADGEPNHHNGFDTTVANDSIEIAGNLKKEAGVTIYSVCIAEGANASNETSNINKFMHYVSSNYPDATSMTSPGTRASGSDYYKTIDNDHSLSLIFESIIEEIDHPTISMGEEATMVDTISPYFDFVGNASNVKLQTSARNADGTWAEPVDDSALSCEITDDRLIVNGFDFDANFVSSTGRGVNNDFYGKQLVISFTVTPDYDVIDAASATLMDGILPTNSGLASLNDSDSAPAAEVETPVLNTHQVIYKVDGAEVASYNRFVGSDVIVDAIPTKEGHTFSGWTMNGTPVNPDDEFTMPDGDVEIVGTFTARTWNVSYQYSGTPLANAPTLPATAPAVFGSTVTIAPPAVLEGYIFSGWKPLQTDVILSNGTSFTMPDKDVTLVGYFESSTTIPYKVEHYLETLTDDVYETTPALVEDGFTGTTGHTVTATPLNRFTGFAYNETKSADTISGAILGDGSLVLKVYYDRNEYKVTYAYSGDVPQDQPAKPQDETYKYGESVTVADNVSVAGYTFEGWKSQSTDKTAGESFEMPAHDVAFIGEFTANTDTLYKVEYYLQNIEGTDYDLDNASSYESTATTGATVYANQKEFEGFVFDDANVNNKLSGEVAGDGSLVLKRYYNRIKYKVTYAYEGDQPTGAPSLPVDDTEYVYGATVTVKPDLDLEGYNFAGWHSSGYAVNNDTASFTMPARDVKLYGSFEPASGVVWKEEHYFEDLEGGTYTLKYTFDHTGTTGETAQAQPIAEEPGFEFDSTHAENVVSATIEGDGSTVLKFHYKRLTYNVSYVYDPATQPDGAPDLPVDNTDYKYGQEVTIADKLSFTGYDFAGWDPEQNITVMDNKFIMPAHNIVFEGNFVPRSDTKYEVHHHLMQADGTYPANPDFVNEHSGTTGHEVPAIPRNFEGYTLNETESQMSGVVKADGTLVLDLKYDRIKYKVIYAYEGDIPDGVTQPIGYDEYIHGSLVSVEAIPSSIPAGHTFVGWYRGTTANPISGTFEMPMFDVHILGQFVKDTDTPYRVEHYLQNVDGTGYDLDSSETRHGTTGATVFALAKEYPGFTYQSGISITSGTIAGNGSFALKFYYNRNTHNVTYEYEGITPDGAPTKPEPVENVPFGKNITVADVPSVPGYTFTGWYNGADTNIVTSFAMPDKDVTLKGKFASNLVDYQVKYWLQNLDAGDTFDADEYTLDTANSYTRQAYVGEHVEADSIEHTGFSVNEHSNTYGHVAVDAGGSGNLVLNVYFDRHTYDVTYGYYGEQPADVPDLTGKNKTKVRFGTVVDVESKPTHSGYVFDGWYTRTATVENDKFTMPDHDVAFLGRFSQMHTVSYDLNGGAGAEGVDYSAENVASGSNVIVKQTPTRTNYRFTGWKSELGTNASGDSVTVNQDITFVAQWSYNGGGGGGGGSVTRYTLTYESNGGTEYKDERYSRNTTVDIERKPEKEGYVFEGWYEDKELTKYVTEVKMTKDITVYAKWVEDNGGAGNGYDTPGSLNGEDHFAYVVGYPDGTVRPNDNISRAEVTAIFFRLLKPDEVRDKNLTTENNFNDVNGEDWHNASISTMAKLGIVKGRYADAFVPDAFITRAEFAAICARFDDSDFEVIDNFTDVQEHWAEHDIHEAAAHGWIRGYEDGTFKPDQFITRAEAMTMINRVLNRVPETANDLLADMINWPDNSDKSAWYYLAVQEATNSHDYEMKNHIYEKWTTLREVTDWTKYE